MQKRIIGAAAVLAAAAGAVRAQTDLVANGGLETGAFGPEWTQFGDTNFTAVSGPFGGITPHGGSFLGYFGPVNGPGGIQQTLSATTGQQVFVDFWYQAQGATNSFTAMLGNTTLVSLTNDTAHTTWTEFTFLVTVDTDNPVLSFAFTNPPSYDYLDDVHVYSNGFGACCLGDGSCVAQTAAGCAAAAGVYRGNGVPCGVVNCPVGACCLPNGSCTVTGAGGCLAASGIYRGDGSTCASANCTPVAFAPVPLQWNFNGMVHGATEQGPANRDNPAGYRAIADRGLLLDGSAAALNAGPIVDADSRPFTIVTQPGQLDIVSLGDRRFVANAARAWGTGTDNGLQPSWLPSSDLTGPQISDVSPLHATFTTQTSLAFLYQISDGGGRFDVVLRFTDNSTATVTLRGPDWYGDRSPPAPTTGSGIAAQRKLGVYTGTGSTDLANADNPLNVAEAVITTASLQAAGLGSFAGKQLASITFQNPISNTTTYTNSTLANASGIAIISATIGGFTGGASCYANCDGSTVQPILNVNDFICFQTKYAQNDTYANCDGSTVQPILNVNDFICFQTKYAQGCP